ncbi:MAG TPA: alpha/beta fold hydrolase [Caulobacteraceae bacterium]|jgi:putative redox protein|nr:alpha/beta fold hydrolase [Caulobacteraceae bacterium]
MASIKFDFEGRSGHKLAGVLETGAAPPRAWAVYAHCFTCGKASLAATRVSRFLAARGIGVLRFDFSGLGQSEGAFGGGLSADVADVIDAVRAMGEQGMPVQLLVGHSFGGAAVIAAAGDLPEVKAVVTIGAPARAEHVLHELPSDLGDLPPGEVRDVTLDGRVFQMGASFVRDIEQQDQMARIHGLGRALLVMHSPVDQTVGVENASEIFLNARHPKSFVSLDHADHLLTKAADADYAAGVIANWASRYFTPLAPVQADTAAQAGPPAVHAEETGAGRYQTRISGPGWTFLADEPVDVGGLGSGPSPHDLLSAGLGACTAMTCRMYAERKGWPLRHITVEVSRTGKTATQKDHFERRICFEGDLDDEQRARLFEIADRCPVHRTLTEGSTVSTIAMTAFEEV